VPQSATLALKISDLTGTPDNVTPTLSISNIEGPRNGSFEPNENGGYSYKSNPGFLGTDFVTIKVTDGTNDSNLITVFFQVGP
jgi:hypothetical protein